MKWLQIQKVDFTTEQNLIWTIIFYLKYYVFSI